MQFRLVEDSPDSALHVESLKARNELIEKILDCWPRLAEIQLWVLPRGSGYERIPGSIDCEVEDDDRYLPQIDDQHIAGDEVELRRQTEELNRERAQVAKQIADVAIQACREAIDRYSKARTFKVGIMCYAKNGTIEQVFEQKFSAAAIGELPKPDAAEDSTSNEPSSSVIDRLSLAIEQLTASAATTAEQLREEKGDLHTRILDLIDKNMGMLDKNKDLVQQTLTHVQLPPEHYVLEGQKMKMRSDAQQAAMVENVRASMAADRQETLRQFSKDNPNAVENLIEAAMVVVENMRKAEGAEAPANETTSKKGTGNASPEPESESTPQEPAENAAPAYCRGTTKLRRFIDDETVAKLQANLLPEGWAVLEPLLHCTSEAAFRRQINAISAALSEMEESDQEIFRNGLKASISGPGQLRLVNLLGGYGVRLV